MSPHDAMAGSEPIERSAVGATETTAIASLATTSDVRGSVSGKYPTSDPGSPTDTRGPHPYNQYQNSVGANQQPPHRAITPPLVGSGVAPTGFMPPLAGSGSFASALARSLHPAQGAVGTVMHSIAPHGHQAIHNPIIPSAQVAGPHNLVPGHLQHLLLAPIAAPAIQGHYAGGLVPAPTYTHNLIPLSLQAAAAAQLQQPLAALPLQQLQPALVGLDTAQSLLPPGVAGPVPPPLSLALGPQPPTLPTLQSALHAQQLLGPLSQGPPRPVPGSEHGMPSGPALCVQDLNPAIAGAPVFNGVNPNYPGLRVVNSDPPVFAVDDFLSTEECAFLISAACDSFGPAPVVGAGAGEISPSRTSSTCYLAREDLPEYLGKVSALTGKPVRHCELPQVGRYLPSQQYLQHFDAFDLSTEDGRRFASNGGQRTVTVLVYLCDVARGGATSFPALGLDVQPRKGTALIFFPATVDGYLDKRALHAALPAVDVKYVSQVWIRQGDYDGLPSKRLGRDRDAAVREAARLTGGGGI